MFVLPLVCARALLRSLLCGHATFLHSLRAGCQYLGKTDLVPRPGGRRYMIFGPPDKIHVGLSVINVGYTDRPGPWKQIQHEIQSRQVLFRIAGDACIDTSTPLD